MLDTCRTADVGLVGLSAGPVGTLSAAALLAKSVVRVVVLR